MGKYELQVLVARCTCGRRSSVVSHTVLHRREYYILFVTQHQSSCFFILLITLPLCASGSRPCQDALGPEAVDVFCHHRGRRGLHPPNPSATIPGGAKLSFLRRISVYSGLRIRRFGLLHVLTGLEIPSALDKAVLGMHHRKNCLRWTQLGL